jgi:hypothetical protein
MSIKSTARADRGEGQRAHFLQALARRASVREACDAADVSRQTVYRWRREDEGFAAAWAEAIDSAVERLEEVVYSRATEKSDLLAMFWLKAHKRMYRDDVSVELSGPGGGPIEVKDADLDAKIAAMIGGVAARRGQMGLPLIDAEVVSREESVEDSREEPREEWAERGELRVLLAGNTDAGEPRVMEFEQE